MLLVVAALLGIPAQAKPLPVVNLTPGAVLSKSCRVSPKVYAFASADESWKKSAIRVKGDNLVLDFQGSTLLGSPRTAHPDQRKGLAVIVEGNNVTVRNLNIRGYKVGVIARNCKGLKLINCDFSYNWKQRLQSTPEKEVESDWMSFHHNEKGEWLRYGAGAYLDGCESFEVKGLRVNGGQCGLMLNRSNKGLIWNSDLSFNSAIGLGMYRSSNNRVMHNKMDWCVRGYSHGVYNRGQDSAGILVFEQCNKNVFAYNSATHGGDGFFLWAGQTTMDTGQGGCNDNLLYGNDLSHSPANAIEATFSRNRFVMNKLVDCWHGVWGGYSYDSVIMANLFAVNGESIAIEHGQNNKIQFNQFLGDTVSLYLWQNSSAPDPNWGYPKHRDTANKGTVVETNIFRHIADTAIQLGSGRDITIHQNAIANATKTFRIDGNPTGIKLTDNQIASTEQEPTLPVEVYTGNIWAPGMEPPKPVITRGGNAIPANEPTGQAYFDQFNIRWIADRDMVFLAQKAKKERNMSADTLAMIASHYVKPITGAKFPYLAEGSLRGRKYMIVDEWGPYDFKRPLLWPQHASVYKKVSENHDGRAFMILGPKGKWKLKASSAGVVGPTSGQVPGEATFSWPLNAKNVSIVLEYTGGEVVDVLGNKTPAGQPVAFRYAKSFQPIEWSVKFWSWDETRDPRTNYAAYTKWMDSTPLAVMKVNELAFATGGSPYQGVPDNKFATLADGEFEVEGGAYKLNVTADDGVKVWLDGKLLIDEWHWQAPTLYQRDVTLSKGKHKLEVQHFEIDGYTALKVEIKPKGP